MGLGNPQRRVPPHMSNFDKSGVGYVLTKLIMCESDRIDGDYRSKFLQGRKSYSVST